MLTPLQQAKISLGAAQRNLNTAKKSGVLKRITNAEEALRNAEANVIKEEIAEAAEQLAEEHVLYWKQQNAKRIKPT